MKRAGASEKIQWQGEHWDMPVPLMCGNSERQKARNSRDKQRRRLGLTEDLWLGQKSSSTPGWCLSTAVSVPLPLAGTGPNLAEGRRIWCEAPSLLLFSSAASLCHPEDAALC